MVWPVAVTYTCNAATLEAEFWNCMDLVPVGDNSPSVGKRILKIQHNEKNLTKC